MIAITRHDVADGYLTVQRLKGSRKTIHPLLEIENHLLNERAAVFDYIAKMQGIKELVPVSRWIFWRHMRQYAKAAGTSKNLRNLRILKHSIADGSYRKNST